MAPCHKRQSRFSIKNNKTMKLCVFDFDNTLFKSPEPPKSWQGGWWGKAFSLEPPVVPEKPDMTWWSHGLLDKIKECSEQKDCYVILLTGRRENIFKTRVMDLLDQVGIISYFDFIGLNNKNDTLAYKIETLNKFLEKDPRINEVEFWDDRVIHAQPFKDWAKDNKLVCTHHLVEPIKKQPEGLP